MTKISEIRNALLRGDQKIIAQIVGCSTEMVKKVLNEERSHKGEKGRKIIQCAQKIIEHRKRLEENLRN